MRCGPGVLALLMTGMHMTLLGTLITLAQHPQYGRPLLDQQLGGLIMLAVGAVVYTGAGLALAWRGLSDGAPAADSGPPPPGGASKRLELPRQTG